VRAARGLRPDPPAGPLAQLWCFVHGYITLKLAEHFIQLEDPVAQVLLPMGVNLAVGLGNTRERAQASPRCRRSPVRLERDGQVPSGGWLGEGDQALDVRLGREGLVSALVDTGHEFVGECATEAAVAAGDEGDSAVDRRAPW
jgi:hypothetical protein